MRRFFLILGTFLLHTNQVGAENLLTFEQFSQSYSTFASKSNLTPNEQVETSKALPKKIDNNDFLNFFEALNSKDPQFANSALYILEKNQSETPKEFYLNSLSKSLSERQIKYLLVWNPFYFLEKLATSYEGNREIEGLIESFDYISRLGVPRKQYKAWDENQQQLTRKALLNNDYYLAVYTAYFLGQFLDAQTLQNFHPDIYKALYKQDTLQFTTSGSSFFEGFTNQKIPNTVPGLNRRIETKSITSSVSREHVKPPNETQTKRTSDKTRKENLSKSIQQILLALVFLAILFLLYQKKNSLSE